MAMSIHDELMKFLLNPVPTVSNTVGSGSNFTNISTATTQTVKTGAGTLKGVVVNNKGTVASLVTIYDSATASGSKIATLDSLNLSGTFDYNVNFNNGLTIVTTGTIAPDITIIWK